MAIKLADTARPNNYVDAEHPGTFPVAYAEDVWFADGTRLSEKTFSGDSIQKEELPVASATEAGHVYQYLGASGTYEHGCFYECVITRTAPITVYGWKLLNVIKNPVIYTENEPTLGQYDDGAIIVYAGEDTYGYKKGHHYQSIIDRQMAVHSVTGSGSGGANIDANIYKDKLIVGEHLLSSVGVLAGYITEVNEDSFSWYSLYYDEIQEITNVTVSSSTTTKTVTDYIDIGGGGGESSTPIDAVTNGNMNPVTSNAVYNAVAYRNNPTVVCTLRRRRTDGTGDEEIGTTTTCLVIPLVGPDNIALIIGSGEVLVNSTEIQQKFGFSLSGIQPDGIVNYGMVDIAVTRQPSPYLSYAAGFHDFWVDGIPTPPPSDTKCVARFMCVAKLQ